MPIYVYETLPGRSKQRIKRFEIWQRMTDEPLKTHPETGEPVRRIIIGGIGAPDSIVDTSAKRSRTRP